MPFKVKCRCGQELILRYGEWVYFSIGVLLLFLFINLAVSLFLYLDLKRLREEVAIAKASAPGARSETSAPIAAPSDVSGDGKVGSVAAPSEDASPRASPKEPATPAVSEGAADERPGPAEAHDAPSAPGGADATAAPPPPERAAASPPLEAEESGAVPEPAPAAPAAGPAPLVRVVLLARLWGGPSVAEGRLGEETLRLSVDLLSDADPRVRQAAARAMGEWLLSRPDEEVAALASAAWLREALEASRELRARLEGAPVGRRLIERSGAPAASSPAPDGGSGSSRGVDSDPQKGGGGEEAEGRLAAAIASRSQLVELQARLARWQAGGLDVVLALDATESMEEAYAAIRARGTEMVSTMLWAVPSSRLGVLFYRDDVVRTVPLGTQAREIARALQDESASGGGHDVHEGVYEALRGALQLGRFAWRDSADKVLIFIGDAPPPYEKKAPLLSLARAARLEAGFTIHAISVRPWEGWDGVPFFADLARAGGGVAKRPSLEALGSELLLLLFPEQLRHTLEAALAFFGAGLGGA